MPLRRSRARPLRPLVLLPGQSRQILHKHAPEQSSYLRFPPSPTSLQAVPRTPLTPPLRLHLRTILPIPPLSPQYRNTAPEAPGPWVWRCHKCGCVYQIGVTRRCLHDGHFFCSIPPSPPTPVNVDEVAIDQEDSLEGSNAEDPLSFRRRRMQNVQKRRQKSRRQQRKVGCSSEFDYSGWADYNFWRRCVKTYYYEKAAARRRQNDGGQEDDGEERHLEYATQKNCWNDCEFPSECNNNRLQEEAERGRIRALFVTSERASAEFSDTDVDSPISEEEGERFDFQGKVMEIEEWEAELQRQKVAEFETAKREMDELEKFAIAVYGGSESSSLPSTSASCSTSSTIGTEEMGIVDMERRGLEGEAQMVDIGLGPISASDLAWEDEEIYGSGFADKKRKKSIQKIAQLTGLMLGVEPVERGYEEDKPRSPLQEGWTFGE